MLVEVVACDESDIRGLQQALEEETELRLAYLFGSRARGDASDASDFDVAVLGDRPLGVLELGALIERLQATQNGRPVDVVDLASAPPLLCDEVVRDGVPLVGSPEDRLDFELKTFQRVQDTRPLRRIQQELIREAARHGRSA